MAGLSRGAASERYTGEGQIPLEPPLDDQRLRHRRTELSSVEQEIWPALGSRLWTGPER